MDFPVPLQCCIAYTYVWVFSDAVSPELSLTIVDLGTKRARRTPGRRLVAAIGDHGDRAPLSTHPPRGPPAACRASASPPASPACDDAQWSGRIHCWFGIAMAGKIELAIWNPCRRGRPAHASRAHVAPRLVLEGAFLARLAAVDDEVPGIASPPACQAETRGPSAQHHALADANPPHLSLGRNARMPANNTRKLIAWSRDDGFMSMESGLRLLRLRRNADLHGSSPGHHRAHRDRQPAQPAQPAGTDFPERSGQRRGGPSAALLAAGEQPANGVVQLVRGNRRGEVRRVRLREPQRRVPQVVGQRHGRSWG